MFDQTVCSDSALIHRYSSHKPTTSQFFVLAGQDWETTALKTIRESPFFYKRKNFFHFINSKLKHNYLPTDRNLQQKDNRTKRQFLLHSLKCFFSSSFLLLLHKMSRSNKAKEVQGWQNKSLFYSVSAAQRNLFDNIHLFLTQCSDC